MSCPRIATALIIVAAFLSLPFTSFGSGHSGDGYEFTETDTVIETSGSAFSSFIDNQGQLNRDDIHFYSTGPGRIGFGTDRAVFVLDDPEAGSLSYEVYFKGCNPTFPEGIGPSSSVFNYLVGSREDWRTNVPSFTEVYYTDLWDGIDLRYRINHGVVKYDLILHPGANPDDIRMEYIGLEEMNIQGNGDLSIITAIVSVIDRDLISFQGNCHVPVVFSLREGNEITFDIGEYDHDRDLIIDPYLEFSTYAPGSVNEVTFRQSGGNGDDLYIAGQTQSPDFPTTPGVIDTSMEKYEGFISRIKSDLSDFIFSTMLGGSETDKIRDMVIDSDGNIFVGGSTTSLDFPTTTGALNETSNIWTDPHTPRPDDDETFGDAFLTKLNPDGADLIYSTYLGGHNGESVKNIDIDSSGYLYASGYVRSSDFPVVDAYQDALLGHEDSFILKLNPQGSELLFSTYFGFNETWGFYMDYDDIRDIEVDELGRVVFCGTTDNEAFPITTGAYRSDYVNDMGYVAMLFPDGSGLEFCTYICPGMIPNRLALDDFNDIHIAGFMISDTLDLTSNALDRTFSDQLEGFLSTLDFNGTTLKYSTYFGGSRDERVYDIKIDSSSNIWISGGTTSSDIPVTENAYRNANSGNGDGFAACFSSGGTTLLLSTYFGGSEDENALGIIPLNMNEVYICGKTMSADLPTTEGVLRENYSGPDTYISKIKVNSGIPSAPVNPYIVEGDGLINISWFKPISTGNEEILNFSVYRSIDDNDFDLVSVVDVGIKWFNDTGLENGVIHYYRISASNIVGESPPTHSISGIPSTVPGKTIVTADEIGDSFINISWTDPDDDGGREIIGYTAYIGPSIDDLSSFDTTDKKWFNFTDLINGQIYFLSVSASNQIGEGSISDLITAIPMNHPSQPLNLKACPGEGFVHLYWDRPEDDGGESDLTYAVFESEDNITFDLLEDGIESTDYNVTPFPSGDFRLFHVRAANPMGFSLPSNVAFSKSVGRPTVPRDFTVSMGDSSAYLRWQMPESFGGFDSVTYSVYSGTRPDNMKKPISGFSGISFDVEGLTNGETYYFAVSAVNIGGEGPWTDIIHGIPFGPPSKPTNLTAEPIDSGVILRWGPPDDFGGSSRISYVIYSGANPDIQADIGSTNSTRHAVSNLENGVVYYFRVRARIGDIDGEISDLVSGIPMGLPGSPRNIDVTVGDGSLLISWNEPLNEGGSPLLSYRVLITLLSSDLTITYDDILNESLEISGLINGEEYSVLVLAVNEMGASIPTEEITAIPLGPPGPPISFVVIQSGSDIKLRWASPKSDGGSDLSGYRIYRGTSEDDMKLLAELDPTAVSFTDENTLEGVVYHYRITAFNNIGESESTSTISVEIVDSSDPGSNDMMIAIIIIGSLIIVLLLILIYISYTKRSSNDQEDRDQTTGLYADYHQYPSDQMIPPMGSDGIERSEE